jgi:uncharacterized membrane protein
MHMLAVVSLFAVLTLVGVEFGVTAFANPAAWRLQPEPQKLMLARLALVLGRVMPVWYPLCAVLLGLETWAHWGGSARGYLLAADALWVAASLGSMVWLVPLNTRIAEGAPDWQRLHRVWDRRHRVRTAALALAALLLAYAVVG